MKNSARSLVGVGPTRELSLRVSVASLARVLFRTPSSDCWMLALERKATLVEEENKDNVEVIAQPFGGAVRILNLQALNEIVGGFHFDSERSRVEGDFRIFIRPAAWPRLRTLLIEHLNRTEDPILETDLGRELLEEFGDSLKIKLRPDQYVSKPVGVILEDNPNPTQNTRARGYPTVRAYRIYESTLSDLALAQMIIDYSNRYSDSNLADLALHDAENGGRGRANGILALPMEEIVGFYSRVPFEDRNTHFLFEGYQLAETVAAILEGIDVPKYHKYRE